MPNAEHTGTYLLRVLTRPPMSRARLPPTRLAQPNDQPHATICDLAYGLGISKTLLFGSGGICVIASTLLMEPNYRAFDRSSSGIACY